MTQNTSGSRGIELAHSAIAATAAVLVIGLIVWGVNTCSVRNDALKRTCIQSGGTVVPAQGGDFSCVSRSGAISNTQEAR